MSTKKSKPRSEAMKFLDELVGEPLSFGHMLRTIRKCDGLSQTALAQKLGISKAHVCDIERGRKTVSPPRAAEFAKALGYNPAQFVRLALQDQVDTAGLKLKVRVEAA